MVCDLSNNAISNDLEWPIYAKKMRMQMRHSREGLSGNSFK